MAQSLDTVGIFTRDPLMMSDVAHAMIGKGPKRVGKLPKKVYILEDMLNLSDKNVRDSILTVASAARMALGDDAISYLNLSKALFEDEALKMSLVPFSERKGTEKRMKSSDKS